MEHQIDFAKTNQYVETIFKRKINIRELPIRILLLEVLQKDKPLMHQSKVVQQTLLS